MYKLSTLGADCYIEKSPKHMYMEIDYRNYI